MAADELDGPCNFNTLFSKNVPHILEKIFFSLDYESYKICLEVNSEWKELLTSERYITKGKTVFTEKIMLDEDKLCIAAEEDNTDEARRLLASGMVDLNCRHTVHTVNLTHHNSTPLHAAVSKGNKVMAKLLIECGTDPNVADDAG